MELKWMLDFVSLANSGSFSKAAEDRNVTQSAFSRRIKALEEWLGTTLVNRATYPVTLTDSGIRFIETADRMIRLAYKVKEDFGENKYQQKQIISFASATNLASFFVPAWFRKVEAHIGPFDAKIQTDIMGIHTHFESLRQQDNDFLFHFGHSLDSLAMDANKFQYIVVGTDLLIPVCHADLMREQKPKLPGTAETPLPYISPTQATGIAKLIAECIQSSDEALHLDKRFESSILGCSKGLVMEGFGIAWLPKSNIQAELDAKILIPVGDAKYHIPVNIELYRYVANTKPSVIKFWQQITELYADKALTKTTN